MQRFRARGWRMPDGTRFVGRPSRWGNPFRIGQPVPRIVPLPGLPERATGTVPARLVGTSIPDAAIAVSAYELLINTHCLYEDIRIDLRGLNLACWCPLNQPCHRNVLLGIANGTDYGHWECPVAGRRCIPCLKPCTDKPCRCCATRRSP